MTLMLIAFISILVITFALVTFLTRQTDEEKTVNKRLADIGGARAPRFGESRRTDLLRGETSSSLFGLDGRLNDVKFIRAAKARILQADSPTSIESFLLMTAALGIVGFAISYYFFHILLANVLIGLVLGSLPFGYFSFKASRRVAAFDKELPNAADMMARALRAGHSVLGAIEILAEQSSEPLASEFREVFQQQNFGLPMRDSMNQLLERVPSVDLRVLVTAILVQKETGGNLAEILDRTVFVIRERMRITGEIRVQTAQGRLTGWILCLLPVIMLVLINLVDPGYSSLLIKDPIGIKLVYVGLVLMAIGALVIRKIINSIEV